MVLPSLATAVGSNMPTYSINWLCSLFFWDPLPRSLFRFPTFNSPSIFFFRRLTKYVRSYGDRNNDLDSVSKCMSSPLRGGWFVSLSSCDILDLRGKFSAIHREYSPNPRKFYAFCTSVTDTATTAGIIASGTFILFHFRAPAPWTAILLFFPVRDMVIRQHLRQSKLL